LKMQEVLSRQFISEMSFTRRLIRSKTEALQFRIAEHATKVICIPNGPVNHWKNVLTAWGNYLSKLRLKNGNLPMGVDFAYQILYKDPFEPDELSITVSFIEIVAAELNIILDVDVEVVHKKLQQFLWNMSEKIGMGQLVNNVVNNFC